MNQALLRLFEQNPQQYLSGEQISRELNISRTAVWKQIQTLRKSGYSFDAVPRLGYRLTDAPDRLDLETLLTGLDTRVMGRNLRILDSVDSTQNAARELVRQGAPEGTLVLAEEQTAGRGRMGRSWHSPKGKGIWMSLILKPRITLSFTPQLTLLVAVALCRAIRQQTGLPAGIKWPNDLLCRGRKISGILLESSAEDERLHYVIAGIGISANLTEADYPDELKDRATSLFIESGRKTDRAALVQAFLKQLEELYDLYHAEGFAPIKLLWEALNVTLGQNVRVGTHRGFVEGTALSIDDRGALNIRTSEGERTVFSGDVEM